MIAAGSAPRTAPTVGQAVGAVAGTAVDQVRDLLVAQLDRWADGLHQRLEASAPTEEPAMDAGRVVHTVTPLVVGLIAGATVALVLAERPART